MGLRKIERILIANRGEIARRVIRACDEMGLTSIAVYTEVDKSLPFVGEAKTAVCLGNDTQAYLDMKAIIKAAKDTKADAIHPGYGFLSERADFARAVEAEGIAFIGPTPETIESMGSKIGAKTLLKDTAPLVPGRTSGSVDEWVAASEEMGYPVLVKASAGGGGRGMRVVWNASELKEAMKTAEGEALRAFGEGSVMLEKYFNEVRHIEVQIFGDAHGNVIHLLERECSIQRRHQKVIEEAPSKFVTPELRKEMCESAVRIAQTINYRGAGTVEFIVDPKTKKFYFLEVNTRLQVEHPVTELVTNLDLVQLQILVAMGVPMKQALPQVRLDKTLPALTTSPTEPIGHAIEVRVYAEDFNLMPTVGDVDLWHTLQKPSDTYYHNAVETGTTISVHYDNMISKVVTWDAYSRDSAIRKCVRALRNTACFGLTNNKLFLLSMLVDEQFSEGSQLCTKWIADRFEVLKATAFSMLSPELIKLSGQVATIWFTAHKKRTHLRHIPSGWSNVGNRTIESVLKVRKSAHGILPPTPYKLSADSVEKEDETGDIPIVVKYTRDRKGVYHFLGSKDAVELIDINERQGFSIVKVQTGGRLESFVVSCKSPSQIEECEVSVMRIEDGIEVTFQKIPSLLFPQNEIAETPTTRPPTQTNYVFSDNQDAAPEEAGITGNKVVSPKMAKVFKILKPQGSTVTKGEAVIILESMKMETKVLSNFDGKINLKCKESDLVRTGKTLFLVE
eukprot:TRINITY_DN2239_c2_g1_i1.p1 TRINITY_DN2239_c2_g1~~TRINITY_DN2239_c2_g1_i1.p1  ORF type:complete len:735 (+),score=181.02 TRINITY_DN2239_c2_g1_i1:66-2270(+)